MIWKLKNHITLKFQIGLQRWNMVDDDDDDDDGGDNNVESMRWNIKASATALSSVEIA